MATVQDQTIEQLRSQLAKSNAKLLIERLHRLLSDHETKDLTPALVRDAVERVLEVQ